MATYEEDEIMRLERDMCGSTVFSRCFALPTNCPRCGDWLVAPEASEFVEGGEIHHHWLCDSCGAHSLTSVALADLEPGQPETNCRE
jgi:hypothetical protein